jgi:hypothetical protein
MVSVYQNRICSSVDKKASSKAFPIESKGRDLLEIGVRQLRYCQALKAEKSRIGSLALSCD